MSCSMCEAPCPPNDYVCQRCAADEGEPAGPQTWPCPQCKKQTTGCPEWVAGGEYNAWCPECLFDVPAKEEADTMAEPTCCDCGVTASADPYCQIPPGDEEFYPNGPADFAREDGTYNPDVNRYCCTPCYVRRGCPSSPTGWAAR